MAISANAVWNLRSSATGTAGKNGGFFVTGASGTNYSLQDGAQYPLIVVTSVVAGNVILTASAADDMVGNGLFVVSGTNFTINSWFEITSVVPGVSITVSTNATGTAICTGAGPNGVINIGGANHLNSTLSDDMFEAATAGNVYYIKSGSYTVGETISLTRDGTTSAPIKVKGYTETHGDSCTGSSRPTLDFAAFVLLSGQYFHWENISFRGTGAYVITLQSGDKLLNCKVINKSTTASRIAVTMDANTAIYSCELCSYRGTALSVPHSAAAIGCYIHDSVTGISFTGTNQIFSILGNLIIDCVTGILTNAATSAVLTIANNTIYSPMRAATTSVGTLGLSITATLCTMIQVTGNIFAQLGTGISAATNGLHSWAHYNNFYGNTTDVSTWVKDPTDTAVNPSFASVSVVSGTTATTAASNQLRQAGATFQSSGVVAGRDYVYIVSGTLVTAGVYGILTVDSETQLTLDITLAANGTSVVWAITVGRNFAVGPAMKALAGPPLPCEQTVSYAEQGAVQRREKGTTVSAFIG